MASARSKSRPPGKRWGPWLALILLVGPLGTALPAPPAYAGEENNDQERIVVRLVTDFEKQTLVSDLEDLQPVVRTIFDEKGTKTVTLGERATLWVRNASVDGKFTFERYHQGKYINRSADLEIEKVQLGVGEHVIEPGRHKFTLTPDWKLTSEDPEIRIEGNTLLLRMHKVEIMAVDGAKVGPPEYRLVAAKLGLLAAKPDDPIDPANLPDPKTLPNMLSHARDFYPLAVYLPSNCVGQGYVLYPSWQAFHLTPDGKIDFKAAGLPKVPGIEAAGLRVIIPYRTFRGKISTKIRLQAGVGAVPLAKEMKFGPTLEKIAFRAGVDEPGEDFFLPVDTDFSKHPFKFFLADNTTKDPYAVRLMALEWDRRVYEKGETVSVALRLLQTPDKQTIKAPAVRMAYSPYLPASPDERHWFDITGATWKNDVLTFTVPDLPYDFYDFRVTIHEAGSKETDSPLAGEFLACVVAPGQVGSASFVSNKGRTAFVAGEDIRLQAVLRSSRPRPAGERSIVLKHPDGRTESLAFRDSGEPWVAQPVVIPGRISANLQPGRYELTFAGLPANIGVLPFRFDLAANQKTSLFYIVKPSKYTRPMNNLIPSHSNPRLPAAINLSRAVDSLAELGYNRIDLMTYDTNLHVRPHTDRETLAAADERLPAPASVYQPTPRNQILDACVRNRIEFSDVFLSYNDFHLPRYIEGYITASERWIMREMTSMRHSPALAGMMLYDEMYDQGVTGLDKSHGKLLPAIRNRRAEEIFHKPVSKIKADMARYISRPKPLRDPKALQQYLAYGKWERHGWGDYNTRVANAARSIVPTAKIGTYHRTWMGVGSTIGAINGWPPDVFENLDICSHVHYADNSTGWPHSSMMVPALRFGKKPVFINIPLTHEVRGRWNGEYQRHMAFAMLAQGADGVSQWGLPHTFENGPNEGMVYGKETTKHLNREILAPFGELIRRTEPGYKKVGIVNTLNQYLLNEFKRIGVANQAEALWIACWRLGYPAVFLYDEAFKQPLTGFQVIFVPGIKFEDELTPEVKERLIEASRAGTKIVVEKGSELKLPGVIELDNPLLDYFVRVYFPTWYDDELNKIFNESQPATDYLAKKLPELGVEPAAKGPFKVGPNWRTGGSINYLVMANFNDPNYGHTVKQQMAAPVRMPLTVPAYRGKVAWDLLAQKKLPLKQQGDEVAFTLDMTRCQGGLVAFLPEDVAALEVTAETTADRRKVRLSGTLIGVSGKPIDGLFPVRIRLLNGAGEAEQEYFRVLGQDLHFEMNLPGAPEARSFTLEVRENITGQTAAVPVRGPAITGPTLSLVPVTDPLIPYPGEVRKFLAETKKAVVVVSERIPGADAVAQELVTALKARGIDAAIKDEMSVFRYPSGDVEQADPFNDGYHTWRSGHEVIQPATIVDSPVIIMGCKSGSYLLEGLTTNGFITEAPIARPGLPVRPSVQVARRGLHYAYDTLCLIANDAAGMRSAVQALLKGVPDKPAQKQPVYVDSRRARSKGISPTTPAIAFMGNNELILDVQFDAAGNMYMITWGHGNNIYSLDPAGKLRLTRHLPEAAAWRLNVYDDRVLVCTAAGSRLYQLTLDGQPISQMRLTMDPGPVVDDEYGLSYPKYEYLPASGRILQNVNGMMRLLGPDGKVLLTWKGEAYTDPDVADKVLHRGLHGYVFSPDGTRLAQLETSMYYTRRGHEDTEVFDTHLVIRDLNGKLLHEYKNIANESEKPTAKVYWSAGMPGPAVVVKGEKWQFNDKLELLYTVAYDPGMLPLTGEKRLVRDGNSLRYLDGEKPEISRMGPFETMPTYATLSPDGKLIALLDEYGVVTVVEAATGRTTATFTLPELPRVMVFTNDSSRLVFGGQRGLVMNYDLKGTPAWQVRLGQFNTALENPPLYDPSFKDLTENLWPTLTDKPGELDQIVRMGEDRLVNGNCEGEGGWQSEALAYYNEGCNSARSLRVGRATVQQEVTKYLGNHATWVLEFFYKAAPGQTQADLLAGVMITNEFPNSVARHFAADGTWRFARIAVKSGRNCSMIKVGFRAAEGDVLVDSVTLRQIRFPSVNHLAYEPLYEIEPVILTNPLFTEDYDPVGDVKLSAFGKVFVPPYASGGKPVVEPAFLQNGRLNDIISFWYEMPPSRDDFGLPVSMALAEPRWVSHVALYFNYYDIKNVAPHFDIYVNDATTGKDVLVASIRNNRKLFQLVKFPPMKAAGVTVRLVNSISRLRTLTEVELYGPLSGKEGAAGFRDPEGQNAYMGDFSRVDKRTKVLPAQFNIPVVTRLPKNNQELWAVTNGQIMAADDKFYVSRTLGISEMYTFDKPTQAKTSTRSKALAYSEFVTLYGGLLLKCGSHGRLYCIEADTGQTIWTVQIGTRPTGAPVAIAEDIFIASDTGRLYKIDLANGSVMRDLELSGGVHGSLATDGTRLFMITDDGYLQCVDVRSFNKLWQTKVAPYTDSTPAVDAGIVYTADQQGVARAINAADGSVRWTAQLGQEFTRCPVVTARHVIFGCRGGKLAVLDRADGSVLWARQVNSRFTYEPLVLSDRVLYFEGNQAMLASLADGSAAPLTVPNARSREREPIPMTIYSDPLASLSYYKGNVFVVARCDHPDSSYNYPWHVQGGAFFLLTPKAEKPDAKK